MGQMSNYDPMNFGRMLYARMKRLSLVSALSSQET